MVPIGTHGVEMSPATMAWVIPGARIGQTVAALEEVPPLAPSESSPSELVALVVGQERGR